MADLTQKKTAWISRYVNAIDLFIKQVEVLDSMKEEWDANAYATGASPPGNNITDADCLLIAPWITAVQLNQSIGAQVTVGNTITSNRGYLEAIRP
jgi:hypothetical protein